MPSTFASFQVDADPSLGSVEMTTLPPASATTQSAELAQEMPNTALRSAETGAFHLEAPPAGSVEVTT